MNSLIDRYVYDVTRRLPENEREEVGKELKSNIFDMLSDNPGEDEVKSVLYRLGAPAKLAEQYRQKPRYLISPAYYDEYTRVLKLVLPLVGAVVLAIGMIMGAVDAVKTETAGLLELAIGVLTKGISMGISAAFQALVWTTVGFVIAERAGAKEADKKPAWNVDDLPEIPANDNKDKIPLSDSITELVVTIVFSILGILLCMRAVPYAIFIVNGDTQVLHVFTDSFLRSCIPAIVVTAMFGIAECVVKMQARRWTPLAGISTIVHSLVSLGVMLYLINMNDIFTPEFRTFFQELALDGTGWLQSIQAGGTNTLAIAFTVILVAATAIECGKALYKTIRCKR